MRGKNMSLILVNIWCRSCCLVLVIESATYSQRVKCKYHDGVSITSGRVTPKKPCFFRQYDLHLSNRGTRFRSR